MNGVCKNRLPEDHFFGRQPYSIGYFGVRGTIHYYRDCCDHEDYGVSWGLDSVVKITVYKSTSEAEFFVNGESQGRFENSIFTEDKLYFGVSTWVYDSEVEILS